jgi:hypothetical protein
LPPSFEAVILRCLEKDRARRFQNVAELAVALVGWNLEDADGPVPLASTAEDRALQLAKLREPILEELREAYRRHYAGPAVEEKKEPTPITIGPS